MYVANIKIFLKTFKLIRVGVIGSSDSTLELESLILKMKNPIPHKRSLKWPFPGLGKDSPLKVDIDIIRKGKKRCPVFPTEKAVGTGQIQSPWIRVNFQNNSQL